MNLAPPSRSPQSGRTSPVYPGRFHPSNYTSAPSSNTRTTTSMPTTGQQRLREHHERLLSFYQLGFAIPSSNRTPRTAAAAGSARPRSPKLAPLGSPGPVTPLELEESEDYFSMGAKTTQRRHKQSSSEVASQTSGEVTDREDMKRRELLAVGRPTASDRSSAYH